MEEDINQEGNEELQSNFSQQMQIPTEVTYLGDPLLSQVSSSSVELYFASPASVPHTH
jgi:hypothetical protein